MSKELTDVIESVVDGWYAEGRMDWDNFLDRVEKMSKVDLGMDLDSPLIRAIKNYTRAYRRL